MHKIALTLGLVILMLAVNVNAYPYQMNFFSYSDSASPFDINIPGFETTLSCTNQLSAKASMTGTGFSLTSTFLSPGSTIVGIGTLTDQNSFTCKNIGETQTTSANGDIFESEMSIVHTATNGNVTSTAFYNCSSSSTDLWLNVSINSTTDLTSYGHVVNRYSDLETSLQSNESVAAKINVSNFNDCAAISPQASAYTQVSVSTSAAGTSDRQLQLFYPFNTSSGIFRYNISSSLPYIECGSSCANELFISLHLLLVNMEDSSYQILNEDSDGCIGTGEITGNFEDTLNLEKDALFALVMISSFDDAAGCGGDARTMTMSEPEFVDYDIYIYEADLVCGDWSACDGTTQTRTCIDSRGIAPPEIQFRACALGIVENATLGFESFFSTNDVLKCSPNWNLFIGCTYSIGNVTLDRPTGWNVVDPAYGFANFLQMTQEYATEGTRSLKMWQIPPKTGEVIDNDTCGNLTSSIIPQIFQGVSNDTFSVSHNVTFPAENMQISFDVKACNSQVLQHSALVDEGLLFNVTLCNQKCYGNLCDTQPNANFAFNVLDNDTGSSIFDVAQYLEASDRTLSPIYEISDLGIIPGKTYNIVFAMSNENPNDATGNCVYIDNVQYQVSEINLEEFGCTTRCDGSTRIESSRTQNGSCFQIFQEDSPLCSDSATAQSIENEEDHCADSRTLKTFIPKSGKFENIACSEGFVCNPFPVQVGNPGSCITEEEAEVETEDSTVPAEDSQTFLNWFNWLFSPLFIFVIISFLISAIVSTVGEGLARFQIFGSVLVVMMIIGTLPGIDIIPIWVSIAIIVIVALMIAKTLGIFAGTNNG